MRIYTSALIAILLFSASAPIAHAQFVMATPGLDTALYNSIGIYGEDDTDVSNDRFFSAENAKTSYSNIPLGSLTYTADATVREAIYAKLFTAQQRAELEAELGTDDLIAAIGYEMDSYGLQANNIADAMSAWAIGANEIISGDNANIDEATTKAVQTQFAIGLLSSPELQAATDAEKQQLAESLLIYAFFYDQGLMVKQTNPSAYRGFQDAARKHASQLGFKFSELELIQGEGFRAKGGARSLGAKTQIESEDDDDTATFSDRDMELLERFRKGQ